MRNLCFLTVFLFLTIQAGAQSMWEQVTSGTTKNLISISFGTSGIGYIGGTDSSLLKTTDGGVTWTAVNYSGLSFSPIEKDIIHVNFLNADTGYAIISNFSNPSYLGRLFRTVDGGMNWSEVITGTIAPFSTFFFDVDNGYEVGSAFFAGHVIIKQTSGNWGQSVYFNFSPQDFLYTIDCYNSNTCVAGGSGGFVYRSFDAGNTWDTVKTITDSTIHALKFLNDHTILAACDNPMGGLIISNDTGRTWQYDMNSLTFLYPQLKGLAVSKKDSFIAVGKVNWDTTGVILSWHNGFANGGSAPEVLYGVAMANDSVGYVVGDNGLIMSNRNFLLSVSSPELKQQQLSVYPNPSEGWINTEMREQHQVYLYDVSGKLIYQSDHFSAAHHINTEGMAKGACLLKAEVKLEKPVWRKLLIR
jgi:photosystem II stability/assembly factor-like uncharacterized protein